MISSVVPIIVVLGMMAGCGGSKLPATAPAPVATATASAPTAVGAVATLAALGLGDVVWANAVDPVTHQPIQPAESLPADGTTIFALVPIKNVPANATFTATWTYNDTSLDALAVAVGPPPPAIGDWLEFHLTRGSGQSWPRGTYAIHVQAGSGEVVAGSVEVS